VSYNDTLIRTIDARIEAALAGRLTARGTVLARRTAGFGTDTRVLFDDADQAVWIQSVGNCEALEDDRVICLRADGVWTVLGVLARRGASADTFRVNGFTVGTTTSGSYVDMPGSPTVKFVKRYDSSHVRTGVQLSAYASVQAAAIGRVGVSFVGPSGTTTYDVARFYFNTLQEHHSFAGTQEAAGGHAAGEYDVTFRWRRESGGTGVLNVDGNDWGSLDLEERF
jgi:hypothetical protein